MSYVFAILGLGAVCVAWFLIQQAGGDPEGRRSGSCGACTGEGACGSETDPESACQRDDASVVS